MVDHSVTLSIISIRFLQCSGSVSISYGSWSADP